MTRKNFVGLLAMAARRRAIAIAIVYGLSMTVRFATAAGEETEAPEPAAIMTNNGAACESPMPSAVHAELFLTSIEALAPSSHDLARRSQEACHGVRGSNARTPENV